MGGTVVGRQTAHLEPVPVQGCGECGTAAEAREIARKADDDDAVEECSRRIADHPSTHTVRPGSGL